MNGSTETRRKATKVLRLIKNSISETTALGNISKEQDSSAFKVLISTILSARTRDPVTEAASARLFAHFPDSRSLSKAKSGIVAKLIYPVAFYKVKAGRITLVAKIIEKEYKGVVPNDIDRLLNLPGVGRKTANCVLVYAFHTPAIPVDVHVHRVSNRIGLVETREPEETEQRLERVYPRKYWLDVNELFVRFGQMICKPIVPRCGICSVSPLCSYYRNEVLKKKRSGSA